MFTENDFMTPRERVNEVLRQRTLDAKNGTRFGCDRVSDRGGACSEKETQCGDMRCVKPRDTSFLREDACSSHSCTKSWGLEGYPLASVYAPLQAWQELYDAETGLSRGTIFKELDLPFVCGDKKGGNCRGR